MYIFNLAAQKRALLKLFQLPNHQVVIVPFHIDTFMDG